MVLCSERPRPHAATVAGQHILRHCCWDGVRGGEVWKPAVALEGGLEVDCDTVVKWRLYLLIISS